MTKIEKRSMRVLSLLGLTLVAGSVVVTTGCGEDEEPVTQAAPAPVQPSRPAPPPAPRVRSIDELMAELGIDERVKLDERDAPNSTEERIAVLQFFDAFARGNSNDVASLLSSMDQAILASMRQTEENGTTRWDRGTDDIAEIRIWTGPRPDIVGVNASPMANLAVVAYFLDNNGQYQPTMWYLSSTGSGPEFESGPTPLDIMNRMSGTDRVEAWHEVIRQELAMSQMDDVDQQSLQQVLEQRSAPSAPSQPQGPDRPAPPSLPQPGGPGGPGGPGSPSTPID